MRRFAQEERRGGDSNPRYRQYPYDGLANRYLKPLGHLSKVTSGSLQPPNQHCKQINSKLFNFSDMPNSPRMPENDSSGPENVTNSNKLNNKPTELAEIVRAWPDPIAGHKNRHRSHCPGLDQQTRRVMVNLRTAKKQKPPRGLARR